MKSGFAVLVLETTYCRNVETMRINMKKEKKKRENGYISINFTCLGKNNDMQSDRAIRVNSINDELF